MLYIQPLANYVKRNIRHRPWPLCSHRYAAAGVAGRVNMPKEVCTFLRRRALA